MHRALAAVFFCERVLMATTPIPIDENEITLVEILDHVLNSGVVIQGSVVISLAGVDLVYLGVSAVLTSVETALKYVDVPGMSRR
jgi:hypothetical protein